MSELGQKLISLVRDIAEANPDFTYVPPLKVIDASDANGCVYVHDGKPSCLIGHALWMAGVIDSNFEDRGCNTRAAYDLTRQYGVEVEEADWLDSVQRSQDLGVPWGEAVPEADG